MVSTEKVHRVSLVLLVLVTRSVSLTTQITDVLTVASGHIPQFVALTLYPISEQTICTGSHLKVSILFLLTWAR